MMLISLKLCKFYLYEKLKFKFIDSFYMLDFPPASFFFYVTSSTFARFVFAFLGFYIVALHTAATTCQLLEEN